MNKHFWRSAALLLALVYPVCAQSEAALQRFFEGKSVTVKIDLPATQSGVEIYPQRSPALELKTYSQRLKNFGTALQKGDSVLVTKDKLKDNHLEFQLGGGGYGTAWDEQPDDVLAETTAKSRSEQELEKQLRSTTNSYDRDRLQERLDSLRRERRREDQQNKVEAALTTEAKQERISAKRLQGGSRFNLRYEPHVTPEALTPTAVMEALREYLAFPFAESGARERTADANRATDAAASLRKGMTRSEVEAVLGATRQETVKDRDGLQIVSCTYELPGAQVQVDYVNGVLVRYVTASR